MLCNTLAPTSATRLDTGHPPRTRARLAGMRESGHTRPSAWPGSVKLRNGTAVERPRLEEAECACASRTTCADLFTGIHAVR